MRAGPKIGAVALLALALTGAARADEEVYRRTLPATVMVLNKADDGLATGSGVVVDRQRKLVVTNDHVVRGATELTVLFPTYDAEGDLIAERAAYAGQVGELRRRGRLVGARVAARDRQRDLALLELDHLPEDARAIPLAARGPQPGQRVHSIGNPGASGALWLYSRGTVRQVYHRKFTVDEGFEVDARVVETQTPVNPGDSGGPVVNDRGELVAVVQSAQLGRPGQEVRLISTFIDVSEVKALLSRYAEVASPSSHTADPDC
jgi:S1-C subfamily serine protease